MVGGTADRHSVDVVADPAVPGLLRSFNTAGVLAPADVHLARRLMLLAGEGDDLVGLAVALAGRAPRVGHVSVDLATVRSSAVVGEEDAGLESLDWPEPEGWLARVRASALVAATDRPAGARQGARPLHLAGTRLYLDRYWADEAAVAADLLRRVGTAPPQPVPAWLDARLASLFPGDAAADQRDAATTALAGLLTVIAGGPGTGKTTTVARILALLIECADRQGTRPPLIGLAAPTGKAAARMEEAVREEAVALAGSTPVRRYLESLDGFTIHRLLGSRPDSGSRFRHHRGHRLPHDVVVIDEASMVSLALMARLLEAVRPDARLILVGDPGQLVSVEAGAVLADIVGPASGPAPVDALGGVAGAGPAPADRGGPTSGSMPPPPPPPARPRAGLAGRIAFLHVNHRFSGPLAELAAAIRAGRPERVLDVLGGGDRRVRWLPAGAGEVQQELTAWAAGLVSAARAGDGPAALDALSRHRLLCAHRDGPAGVTAWNRHVQDWVAAQVAGADPGGGWYVGRPVMVTANDYGLRLFNGDTGVVVANPGPERNGTASAAGGPLVVAFGGGGRGAVRSVSAYRLPAAETVFAATVHKSQGSEFDRVTLILPAESSRLLTRELLYTAVTRARREVVVVGGEAALRRAVERPVGRASGLADRLWAAGAATGGPGARA